MIYENANAVVGQSGGPTAAINATLAGVIAGCRASGKINKLYGMRNGIEGFEKENRTSACRLTLASAGAVSAVLSV